MKMSWLLFTAFLMVTPLAAHADPQAQTSPTQSIDSTQSTQSTPSSQNQATQDVFSYSYLQVNRLSEWSDYFNDRSAGNGLKFSYGFDGGVYLFGQWNRLDFARLAGHHDLSGIGVGAHQEYSQSTSFFIDLEYLRDRLSASRGGAQDDYWRVAYGFQSHLSSFVALTGAIFTERNTDFGRRPFGERLGLSFGSNMLALGVFGEHTANGNRVEADLNWYYQ
ncbi:MAG TPA: hypothetical protein VNF46_05125 [Gammaproteobacteria bacterium]|nr:hypothetical protein [Gammaproteobacteria bacterium]